MISPKFWKQLTPKLLQAKKPPVTKNPLGKKTSWRKKPNMHHAAAASHRHQEHMNKYIIANRPEYIYNCQSHRNSASS